jgi:hypothetical protein
MPSIEIACIDLQEALTPPAVSFAVVCERGLLSHRSPKARFQPEFDLLSGSLYHLGDPALSGASGGIFSGYELLSGPCRTADPSSFLEFDGQHVVSLHILLEWLLQQSPPGRILFTTDWQFGPDGAYRAPTLTLPAFWELHDSRNLRLNAAYCVSPPA